MARQYAHLNVRCHSAVWLISLLVYLNISTTSAQYNCPVTYASGARPLLFGGLAEEGRCRGAACQPRTLLSKKCGFNSAQAWGICTPQVANTTIELAKRAFGSEMEQLSPCDLLPYLRGRTLWLLGDSHSKTFYRAIQCFLRDFWSQRECQVSPSSELVEELKNQPIRQGYSNCIHLLGPGGGRVCMVEAVVGSNLINNSAISQGGILPLLRAKLAQPQDIFAINFGSWHKSTGPNWKSYQPSLEALGRYYQATKDVWPHLLFRESSASHPGDKVKQKCRRVGGYAFKPSTGELLISPEARADKQTAWQVGTILNEESQQILPKYGVHIVPSYNISVLLWNSHIGMRYSTELDCSHYCHPGLPEVWLWHLYKAMRDGATGIKPLPAAMATTTTTGTSAAVVTEASIASKVQTAAAGPAVAANAPKLQTAAAGPAVAANASKLQTAAAGPAVAANASKLQTAAAGPAVAANASKVQTAAAGPAVAAKPSASTAVAAPAAASLPGAAMRTSNRGARLLHQFTLPDLPRPAETGAPAATATVAPAALSAAPPLYTPFTRPSLVAATAAAQPAVPAVSAPASPTAATTAAAPKLAPAAVQPVPAPATVKPAASATATEAAAGPLGPGEFVCVLSSIRF